MSTTRETITIVEDDDGVRTAMEQLLRSAGFGAISFGSAEAFLASPGGVDADCLIADINLPGMSGVALVQKLSADGTGTPTVLMTGRDDANTAELIRQAGAVRCLRKPFNDDDLFDAIRCAVGT
jgi:FixJ family two-component response regulator